MASIFLSHSNADNAAAADLANRLKAHGFDSLFLDFDPDSGIKAGRNWEQELYRQLKLARAVIVLCSEESMASRWCFVEIAQAKALGKAIFPVKIRECVVESILMDRQVIDMPSLGVDEACIRLFNGLRAAGFDPADSFHWDPRRPPFPGLNYFEAGDAGIYFGREEEVGRVIETLTRLQRQGEPRLLVVIGSSGSGKSSLIRAGVVPRLSKDRSRWKVLAPFRPGVEPIPRLARSVSSAFPETPARPDWRTIRDRLVEESRSEKDDSVRGSRTLTDYADDLTMQVGQPDASLLVIVDQAEELLQNDADPDATAFFNLLRIATERPGGRVFALLTLRSDFLGSFQNHPSLRGLSFADTPLGQLPIERFAQIIEGPADRAAIPLEPGLVPSMIADARTDDALPLLAFTLREMYERCSHQEGLTLKVYRGELGGVTGAVRRVVERIKSEIPWTPETLHAIRRAFLKLVRINDEGQFTRQACRWADLPANAAPVLERLVKARLLASNGDIVEVAHESLFRVWPELATWLDQGRELILWRKTIQNELIRWTENDRSFYYLLTGARVSEGRRWLQGNAEDFSEPELEFINASLEAEDARLAREAAQQEKLRWLARGLAVAALTASIVGIYALRQRNEARDKASLAVEAQAKEKEQRLLAEKETTRAEEQARIATSRRLATLSTTERTRNLDLALLLAAEAVSAQDTLEARNSLFDAIHERPGLITFLHVPEGEIKAIALSPDGKVAAVAYNQDSKGGVQLWDVGSGRSLHAPLVVNEGEVTSLAFSPNGNRIVAGYDLESMLDNKKVHSGGVVIWDLTAPNNQSQDRFEVKEGKVVCVAFSPDGNTLAAGFERDYSDCGLVLWDVATGHRVIPQPAIPEQGSELARWVNEWFKDNGLKPFQLNQGSITSLAFSPDGKRIAAGYSDYNRENGELVPAGGVVRWDLTTWRRVRFQPLKLDEGHVTSLAFSPDGKKVAVGLEKNGEYRDEGGVVLWDLVRFAALSVRDLEVAEGRVRNVSFSPDGTKLFAVAGRSGQGDILQWNLSTLERIEDEKVQISEGRVDCGAMSADGKILATGYNASGGRRGVVLFDPKARTPLLRDEISVNVGLISSVAFHPEGKLVAAAHSVKGNDSGVLLGEQAAGRFRKIEKLAVPDGEVESIGFSHDGKILAAGYQRSVGPPGSYGMIGGVILWDVATRKRLTASPLMVGEGGVYSIAFGPSESRIACGFKQSRVESGKIIETGGFVLWDLASMERITFQPLTAFEGPVTGLAFSPDGNTLAAGYRTGYFKGGVVLWDNCNTQRLNDKSIEYLGGPIREVLFHPKEESLMGLSDESILKWRISAHSLVIEKSLKLRGLGSAWSIANRHDWATFAVGFSGTRQGGVVLWDATNNRRWIDAPIELKNQSVSKVAFDPEGKLLAVAGTFKDGKIPRGVDGGSVSLLDVDIESWLRLAAKMANRNMTRTEWEESFPDLPHRPTFPDLPLPADTETPP